MGGGLLQLVAYGAQDAYLTGNPQITFWRGLYKRHTNFAMEPFRVNLTGQAAWGSKHSAILPRHADLLFNTYLEVDLPRYGEAPATPADEDLAYGWSAAGLGFKLIKYVELDIGGQVIDRIYGEWLQLWSQLTMDYSASEKLKSMISLTEAYSSGEVSTIAITQDSVCGPSPVGGGFIKVSNSKLYIPLMFYFTRSPGAALPLIALQYHEVKINIVWNTSECVTSNYQYEYTAATTTTAGYWSKAGQPPAPPPPKQVNLLVDYVYLDVEERRRMAQESHEYLIEQTQFNEDKGISASNVRIDLTFNHPVKELVWVLQETGDRSCKYKSTLNTTSPHAVGDTLYQPYFYASSYPSSFAIQINGQDRVPLLQEDYFTKVQPYQHHTGQLAPGQYCYSFAIRPEEHQPSGTCNFSRIDTATIVMNGAIVQDLAESDSTLDMRVYAVNYNVLRVMSGMAGLAYSN